MNSSTPLGRLNSNAFEKKMSAIKTNIEKTTQNQVNMKDKLKKLRVINDKLSDSYSVSLRVIVDVSKLMNQYMKFFNQIDDSLKQLDSNANTISQEDIKYINKLTSTNIDNMIKEFNDQLNGMIDLYRKNNMSTNQLMEYKDLLKGINEESRQIQLQGGKKLNKKKSRKF